MKNQIILSIAIALFASSPAHAFEVRTSTGKVKNAQQFKEETTKHYDKMYFLSEIKLKQQKTNRDKAKVACIEIPNAIADAVKFNNMNNHYLMKLLEKKSMSTTKN